MEYLPEAYTGPTGFAHLHCHSIYSALDGVSTIEEYADECEKRNWPGMALTEHGHMASLPDFYFAFKGRGLKPIAGCEIYYNDYEPVRQQIEAGGVKVRSQQWRKDNFELSTRINRNRHLTVLCKNQQGVENLLRLTTEAYDDGLYGAGTKQYNRIWFDKLCKHKEGLIVLSGCLNGPVSHELRYKELLDKDGNVVVERTEKQRVQAAVDYIKKFKAAFGDDYYIELQMPGIEDDHQVFKQLIALADYFKIKIVLANDAHYIVRKDYEIQTIMMATAQGVTIDSPDLFHVNSSEQFFKSRAELWSYWASNKYSDGVDSAAFESMCDNSLEIVDKCEMFTLDGNPKYPRLHDDGGHLTKVVVEELKRRNLYDLPTKFTIDGKSVTYLEQAMIEVGRFINKGFASYFLITQDLISYGKSNGYIFGPRGSAGGSLVCYLLGLHSIDMMKWGLSFDRFLSEARGGYHLNVSMPKPI